LHLAQWQQPDQGRQITVNSNVGSDLAISMATLGLA
jgi:hypothetical protein